MEPESAAAALIAMSLVAMTMASLVRSRRRR
jgi:hypothetical protein